MTLKCWAWLAALSNDQADMADLLTKLTKCELFEVAQACERLTYQAARELERRETEAARALLPGQ